MVSLGDKKFQNGKIYFIGNFIDDEIYIGSSCQPLQKRFQQHKDSLNTYKKNRKLCVKMLELGVEHFYIEEIEKYPCNDIEELRKRERHYILERKPVLNTEIPLRTIKEWREDNKEYIREVKKEYHLQNKEKFNERCKKWHQDNKDTEEYKKKRQEYREKNKEDILKKKREYHQKNKDKINEEKKQYYQENRERFLEKVKKYREENKEKIQARNKEVIKCDCGKDYQRCQRSRHLKSTFHQDYLNNINIENVSSTQEETDNTELQKTNEQTSKWK